MIGRVRPVDDTAPLVQGGGVVALSGALRRPDGRGGDEVDRTERLESDVDGTARLESGVDDTVRLGPGSGAVRPAPRAGVRATAGRPPRTDATVRLAPVRPPVRPPGPPRRPEPRAVVPPPNPAVRPSGPPRPPMPREAARARVGTPGQSRRRVKRTVVPFGAVLLFVAFVVFSGQIFGGDQTTSVPSTAQEQPAGPVPDRRGAHPDGSTGGALPPAQGIQAFSGDTGQQTQPQSPGHQDRSWTWWELLLNVGLVALSLALFTISGTTLWWMLHAWRSPDALAATGFRRRAAYACRSFSLLLPARHEQDVLGDTIDALARLDHPRYEVIVIIGHDDPETELVARKAAARHRRNVRVVIDHNVPKNKPKALNTALPLCRGDIVGVFDAEDEVHPGLLRLVEARFEESGADVVQAGVQLMNVQTSWWSLRNCLEYYFWFRSRLHFHADKRFIPLGGNTVFTRTALLRDANGWDPACLAEDCEIGVRLSTRGAVVAVAYDPEVVTREETPGSIGALVKQRTRWDQGFLQVLRKGEWRKLPSRRQRWLARYTLAMPFLQAATGVLLPLSLVSMFLLKIPVPVALVTFLPLAPTLVTMAVESAALGEFGKEFGIRVRFRDQARLLLGTFPYQVLLAAAAMRAVWRQARGQGGWEKTAHANAHRIERSVTV